MPITSRPFPDGYYVYFMCLHVSTPLSDKSVQGLYQTLKTCMDIKINVANIYSLELSKLTQTRAQEKHFLSSTRKKVCCVCAFVQTVCPHRGTWGLSTGCPKKMSVKPNLEFQTLGGVFLGVKNNSKNFGNKQAEKLKSSEMKDEG